MTQKFEKFKAALIALCIEHDVHLSPSQYDSLQVWERDPRNPDTLDDLNDCTTEPTESSVPPKST